MKKYIFLLGAIMLMAQTVSSQPELVKIIPASSTNFIHVGNLILFTAADSLMKTDGSTAGTVLVKSGFASFSDLKEFNGLLYFVNSSNQLWRSDGTASGTYMLKSFSVGELTYVKAVGSYLYFTARDGATGRELYRTNGTVGGTILLKDINAGVADGINNSDFVSIGSTLYFQGIDAAHGSELWKTDGTPGGTVLVKDINPGAAGSNPEDLLVVNTVIYFAANDDVHGTELWKSDGTAGGTVMVKDVNPGAGNGFAGQMIAAGNTLYFIGSDASNETDLWKTDGTGPGTVKVKDIVQTSQAWDWNMAFLFTKDANVYFYTYDGEYGILSFWKSDGTAAGTVAYAQYNNNMDAIHALVILNGKAYFVYSFQSVGATLVVTDGTAAGTFDRGIACCGDVQVTFEGIFNNYVIFAGYGQGQLNGFYKSNGTPEGSGFFTPGSVDSGQEFVVDGNSVFFTLNDGSEYSGGVVNPDDYKQLFVSDLTTSQSLRSLYGISLSGSDNLIYMNGILYFTTYRDYGINGGVKRLWRYNPSATSCSSSGFITRLVWNDIPGTSISSIPYDSAVPSSVGTVNIFEGPTNVANHYGARYRGYICVPVTGDYTFWIASDDKSELWLSSDATPKGRTRIAYVDGYTNSRQWDKYPSQKSAPVHLIAGHRYYIEALQKEHEGGDNLAVGWQLPGGSLERPIPGIRLSPYNNQLPFVFINTIGNNEVFIAPEQLTIGGYTYDTDGNVVKVEFWAGSTKIGESSGTFPSVVWTNIAPGPYTITAKAFDNDGGVYSTSVNIIVKPQPVQTLFTLVNADTDQDLQYISDGETIYKISGKNINIRYNPVNNPGSVAFYLNGSLYTRENVAPYALAGDLNGDYKPWTTVSPGSYTLEAREYSGTGGTGTLLHSATVHFQVIQPSGPVPPVVYAGPDITIQLPSSSVMLSASMIRIVHWRFNIGVLFPSQAVSRFL